MHGVWPPPVPLGGATSIYCMETSLSGCAHVWLQLQTLKKKKKKRKLGFPGGAVLKNLPANVGDMASISGLRRSPGEGNGNHSSILVWKIPWTEGPGRLQSMGSLRVRHD